MQNWLKEYLNLFPEATERRSSRQYDMAAIERDVAVARKLRKIEPEIIKTIEDHPGWDYPWWWPKLSKVCSASIPLPSVGSSISEWNRVTEQLYESLHHIEVVSIIMRFIHPEEFGIISPPVTSFLQLIPEEDSLTYYRSYLEILGGLRDHYGLNRAADVDMALWSAAHLYLEPEFAALTEVMLHDEYFQQTKLENLFRNWRGLSKHSTPQQMMLARVICKHDYLLAALITARVYESLLIDMGNKLGIDPRPQKPRQSRTGALAAQLEKNESLGLSSDWWTWRNDAVHPEREISKRNAERFVDEISRYIRERVH